MSGVELVERISAYLKRFVVFGGEQQVLALALWVIHTHAFEAADATPYPLITSPEKRSGKSRLLEVLELLVSDGWRIAGASEAVLFRKIDQAKPTLLFDELDAVFGTYSERTEPIRGLLNAGSRRGGAVSRCIGQQHDVEDFEVFCPKCLAGITSGRLPETIRDRSIPIGLHRKTPDETIERFRFRTARSQTEDLVAAVKIWVEEHFDALVAAEPELPEELNDRAAEGFEPLLAIAEALDDSVARAARSAAIALCSEDDIEDASFGAQLLADVRQVWSCGEFGLNLKSQEICDALKKLEDRPWKAWGKGRPVEGLTPRDLARILRPYGPRPKTVRIAPDTTAKGYSRDQFGDAWRRYVPGFDIGVGA